VFPKILVPLQTSLWAFMAFNPGYIKEEDAIKFTDWVNASLVGILAFLAAETVCSTVASKLNLKE